MIETEDQAASLLGWLILLCVALGTIYGEVRKKQRDKKKMSKICTNPGCVRCGKDGQKHPRPEVAHINDGRKPEMHFVEGLEGCPVWDAAGLYYNEKTKIIGEKVLIEVQKFLEGENELVVDENGWKRVFLVNQGVVSQNAIRKLPYTWKTLQKMDLMTGTCFFNVFVSRISPNSTIPVHHGPTNARLRAQLPLTPPNEETTFLVNNDPVQQNPGSWFIFDDSYSHGVEQRNGERLTLIVDMWHPGLGDIGREEIARRWCTTKPAPSQKIGGAALDWPNLGFDFRPTHGFVKYTWKHGSWDAGVFEKDPYFKVHVMSSAIHYGQGLFEGTKAHHCADGKTRLWNLDGNVSRMQEGARRMLIPEVPHEMFIEACDRVVTENLDFLPPYGSGGSMYLRPILFGHGPQLGLQPAPEYTFAVLAIPVSSYYKGGLAPVSVKIVMDADRSAPLGVGNVKVSGNYGADILPSIKARAEGYPTVLYLDAKEKKYIEEFSVSNFIGIKKEKDGRKKYITPKSDTILMSCTNKMLMQLAPRMGYDVEHRPVEVSELNSFDEVAGCGTAVVLMGVKDINYNNEIVKYDSIENVESLYSLYRSIQFGETEDLFKWGSEISTDTGSDVIYTAPSLDETIAKVRGELLGEPGVPSPPQESVTVDMRTAEFEEDGAPKKKKASQKKSKKYVVSRKPGTNKLFIKKRGLNGAKVSSS